MVPTDRAGNADTVLDPSGKQVGGSESGPGIISSASTSATCPPPFQSLKIEAEAGKSQDFSRLRCGSSPRSCPQWAVRAVLWPRGQERHGKLALQCLFWAGSPTCQLVTLPPFQVPAWDAGSWRLWVQRPGWSGREREVWEAGCHVGKQARERAEGACCRDGQRMHHNQHVGPL